MAERGTWETIKGQGNQMLEELRKLLHEGSIRRVVVKQDGSTVAEFPLTVGVVGALAAPVVAAVGALVAVLTRCSIEVERRAEPAKTRPKARRVATRRER